MVSNTLKPLEKLIGSLEKLLAMFRMGQFRTLERCLGLVCFVSDTTDSEVQQKAIYLELCRIMFRADGQVECDHARGED